MKAWAERYGRDGYVTFAIDYYLFTPGQSPSPVFPKPEREVKAAIQYLRHNATLLGISPNRILVHGTSAGARLSSVVFVTPDDPYFTGSERWQGISDRANGFIGFYGSYTGALSSNGDYYYGGSKDSADPAVQERWAKADAISQVAKASGPTIAFHGDLDRRAPYRQTVRFAEALRAAGKNVTYTIVPGADHSFDRTRDRARKLTPDGERAAQQIVVWLKQYFP
jgi:acetyl esterase/lipase